MSTNPTHTGLQLRSLIKPNGELEISLLSVAIPDPAPDEVLVRIEATPINPSDIGLLFGAADINTAKVSGTPASPVVTAQIPSRLMKGMAWGIGGWLLFPFLQRIGAAAAQALRQRVAAELKTTFASSYSKEISLAEALQPEAIAVYAQRATGTKYLINPNKAANT
jgi:hypothetical protein